MHIECIPCREDNYSYLLVCQKSKTAFAVDPSLSAPVLKVIEEQGLTLKAIWNTHHHYDHVEGNLRLLEQFPDIEIVAHASDSGRIPGQNVYAEDGQDLEYGEIRAKVILTPGHTKGAVCYHLYQSGELFVGDTLFAGGCGRLFEGSATEMHRSLMLLCSLAINTRVYCGHEYTLSNLAFCQSIEPENQALMKRIERVKRVLKEGGTSMGFAISEELATNVFVRCSEEQVVQAAGLVSGVEKSEVFSSLRLMKDSF